VYAQASASTGVILIRYPAPARTGLPSQILNLVQHLGDDLVGAFVVVQPGRTRITRSP
jgi:hypothetical protein